MKDSAGWRVGRIMVTRNKTKAEIIGEKKEQYSGKQRLCVD